MEPRSCRGFELLQSQRKLLRNAIGRVAFSAGRFDVSLRLLSLLCAVFVGLNVQSVWAADYWPPEGVRIATFNCSLNRDQAGRLITDLEGGRNEQARKIARILRTVRPAVVLLNEFDFDADGRALKSFHDEYLNKTADWATETPISYRYRFTAPVNTGVPTGRDLDHDKKTDGPVMPLASADFPASTEWSCCLSIQLMKWPSDRFRTFSGKTCPMRHCRPRMEREPGRGTPMRISRSSDCHRRTTGTFPSRFTVGRFSFWSAIRRLRHSTVLKTEMVAGIMMRSGCGRSTFQMSPAVG